MLDLTLEYGSFYSVSTDAFFKECGMYVNDFATEHCRAWLTEQFAYTDYSYASSDRAEAYLKSIGFKANEIRHMHYDEDSPMDQNYWFTYASQWDRAVLIVTGEGYHSERLGWVDVWTSSTGGDYDLDSMFTYWASLYCVRCNAYFDLIYSGGFTSEDYWNLPDSPRSRYGRFEVELNQRWGKTRCPMPGKGTDKAGRHHTHCNGELIGSLNAYDC